MICGTRGVPGTVAPFRAWRGSRDLVAQSPKFHASAVANFKRLLNKSLAQHRECGQIALALAVIFWKLHDQSAAFAPLAGSSAGFT